MEIPESIKKLTTDAPPSALGFQSERKLDVDFFTKCIEGSLSSELKKYYDIGFNYFKISGNDSVSFLKNFFYLFNDYFKSVLRESELDAEKQEAVIENLNLLLKGIEINFSIFEKFISILNLQKNTFDSNKLFMIITGYAINNLRKNHNR
ncbi:MAG: hypothetical protein EBU90_06695 [Proteobacteria bacterium]|nr:hypothetical protein [Pseudomonadota bacterium]NBP14996.1 hypothetical protein [bacterium]